MSKIEFKDVEQKVDDIKIDDVFGAKDLEEDEWNVISGMNYIASKIADEYLDSRDSEEIVGMLADEGMRICDEEQGHDIAEMILKDFVGFAYGEIEDKIYEFLRGK